MEIIKMALKMANGTISRTDPLIKLKCTKTVS